MAKRTIGRSRRQGGGAAVAAGVLLLAGLGLSRGDAMAEENYNLAETHGDIYSTIYEDDSVWVWEAYYEPGEKGRPHSHAKPYTVYIVKGSTFRITEADGSIRDLELKMGGHIVSPARRDHWGWNTDEANDSRFIIIQPK